MYTYFRQTPLYRSMLYALLTILFAAIVLSWINILPYSALNILLTSLYLTVVVWAVSWALGRIFKAKPNAESSFITALILALIFGPLPLADNFAVLTFLGLMAAASKYLLVWRRSHIFNPAAIAALSTALIFDVGASWWVGSIYLLPVVILAGLYETFFKVNRGPLVFSFLAAYSVFFLVRAFFGGSAPLDALDNLWTTLLYSPLLFFSFVMLVEPLTSPAQRNKRIIFGILVAGLVVWLPKILLGASYTLELSLLLGNIFAALSGNQGRLMLRLVKKERLAPNIMGFWFKPSPQRQFQPGQFLNYTLPHRRSDLRGTRRFFSISSSPTEESILLTTKFADKSSSFKKALRSLQKGDELTASRPEGDFVMPTDLNQPLVFVAGGIGVTPYRSMIKYLIDKNEKRPITLIYAARIKEEFVFKDIFDQAKKSLGIKTVYLEKQPLTAESIAQNSPDLKKSLIYISGPEPMVRSLMLELRRSGISRTKIKHDYFPGYTKNY